MTPADELRAAAEKLRKLIAEVDHDIASNPYWDSDEHPPHAHSSLYARGVDNGLGGPAGAYAAAMHPGVGNMLADWLDIAVDYAERWPPDDQTNSPFRLGALALARALNGPA